TPPAPPPLRPESAAFSSAIAPMLVTLLMISTSSAARGIYVFPFAISIAALIRVTSGSRRPKASISFRPSSSDNRSVTCHGSLSAAARRLGLTRASSARARTSGKSDENSSAIIPLRTGLVGFFFFGVRGVRVPGVFLESRPGLEIERAARSQGPRHDLDRIPGLRHKVRGTLHDALALSLREFLEANGVALRRPGLGGVGTVFREHGNRP